jgi:hypothetical protein
MLNKIYLGLLMCFFCHCASSTELKHVDTAYKDLSEITKAHELVDVGETTFSVLFWDIYKSKLKTTAGQYPLCTKLGSILYEINYLMDISTNELIERTIEQWQHLGVKAEIYGVYLSELERIWPNINDGDTLSLFVHKGRSTFYFNEEFVGVIDAPEFGQLFLDIWLSESTSQPVLRDELLGGNINE